MADAKVRAKCSILLQTHVQGTIITVSTISFLAIPAYMETVSISNSETYALALVPWQFWAGLILGVVPPVLVIVRKLYHINDSLKMGEEIARCLLYFYIFCGPMIAVIALMYEQVLPVDTRIHLLGLCSSLAMIVDVNYISRRHWGVKRFSKSSKRGGLRFRGARVSVLHGGSTYSKHSADAVLQKCSSMGSLDMLKAPALNAAFSAFVERSLCYESYKFLLDTTLYAEMVYTSVMNQVLVYETVYMLVRECVRL